MTRDGFAQRLSGYLGIDVDRVQKCIASGSYNTKTQALSGSGYHITANEYLLDKMHRHNWKIANFPRSLRIVLKRVPFSKLSFELDSRQRSSIVSLYSEPTGFSRKTLISSLASWAIIERLTQLSRA